MNSLKTANILNAIIPISRFNKGEANKIFAEVKKDGTRIVVKNNIPECILMNPKDYQEIMEEYENALLAAEAHKRLAEQANPISHKNIVLKGIQKVSINLKPQNEGGYGKSLGNQQPRRKHRGMLFS